MRGPAGALAALALFLVPVAAKATDKLLLEVWINGDTQHRTIAVTQQGNALLADAEDLRGAGLVLPPGTRGAVDLHALPGLAAKIDVPDQVLALTVQARDLDRNVYDLRPSLDRAAPASMRGAVLRYDLTGEAGDLGRLGRTLSGGAGLSLDVFSGDMLFSSSGFANFASHANSARLDTTLEIDDPAAMTHLVFGDAIGGALSWSRAVRFAGVQYASDFSLRPDLVTQPLPAFFGEAAVPTTVEVFSDAAKVFEQDVPPGPFELHDLPIVTGGGTASIVTSDALGRQTTQTLSLYTTTDLLAAGLTSFAFDAGFLRRDYGVKSFGYSQPVASATVRHGFADTWTLEAHGEAAPGLGLLGGGVARSLGGLGAFSLDGALSTGGHGTGWLGGATVEGGSGPLHVFGNLQATGGDFRDLASLDGSAPPLSRWQAGASMDFHHYGALALSWIGETPRRGTPSQFLTASYSLSLAGSASAGVTGLRDLADGKWSVQLFLSIPLGGGYLSGALSAAPDGRTALVAYDHPADPDGGLGWRATAQAGDFARAEADVDWLGDRAHLGAAAAVDGAMPALRADADGALVLLDGALFAARDPGGAMALVHTGVPGVHVARENRPVAVSDSDGDVLLTGLDSNTPNHISVDARDYPMTAALPPSDQSVVTPRRGAVVADFRPQGEIALPNLLTAGAAQAPKRCATGDACLRLADAH
ncbi:MAG: fimbria/pilus outer membrane usher protein [Rhizomicrobium sp.]